MIPNYDKLHIRFALNGFHFNRDELRDVAYSFIKEGESHEKIIGDFLMDWLDEENHLYVKTSGSTGQPKSIKLMKQAMVNSAIATGNFFKLKSGDTALNCLPVNYIAGKMMLVRAMILGLEIDCIIPSSQPVISSKKHYDFCAMVPLQLLNSINAIKNIKVIIVGGTKTSKTLVDSLQKINTTVFETYGMTETITHIAAKQLNNNHYSKQSEASYFKTLPNISISQDKRKCLVINAPKLSDKTIVTNDVVDLKSQKRFKLLGRFDNVINSGGVKLYPEEIEGKLQSVINNRFFIASEIDEQLGEKLILIIENSSESEANILKDVKALKTLNTFETPKKIYTLHKFFETKTGKIQRQKIIKAIS